MDTILIEKQLDKVNPLIKRVFFSIAVAEEIAEIGKRNGLLLDQIDTLIEETGYMVIGLKASRDFVNIISNTLKIRETVARKIVMEINDTVLKDVREEIQKLNNIEQEKVTTSENEIESVESTKKTIPVPSYASEETPLEKAGDLTIEKPVETATVPVYEEANINREALLKGIEDPVSMIDHLLTTPVNTTEKKVEIETPPLAMEKKSYTSDPYREPL